MKSVAIKSFYVISAKDNGKPVFMAIDSYSGGYTYWDENVLTARKFSTIEEVEGSYKLDAALLKNASDICLTHIAIYAEPILNLPHIDLRKAEVEKEILKLKNQLALKEQERDALD